MLVEKSENTRVIRSEEIYSAIDPCRTYVDLNTLFTLDRLELRRMRREGKEDLCVERFEVPLPYLALHEDIFSPILCMSHNGQDWIPATLPHIYDGLLEAICMRQGRFSIDRENILLNITAYTINYVDYPVATFWEPTIPYNKRTPHKYFSKEWMESWEQTSIEDMLKHVEEQIGKIK